MNELFREPHDSCLHLKNDDTLTFGSHYREASLKLNWDIASPQIFATHISPFCDP